MYISDYGNNRIRKVTVSTGIITTVAGIGTTTFSGDNGPATSAGLNNPAGVAVDTSGNIYVGDTSNYRVRKVNVATGIITTIVGTGTNGHSGDGGAATSAMISKPYGVAVDISGMPSMNVFTNMLIHSPTFPIGNVYIPDFLNNCIRKMTAVFTFAPR